MIRAGDGEPLVLLHGVLSSERAWTHVVPLLADHHDTVALTLLGHRGGSRPDQRARSLELLSGIVAATRAAREYLDPLVDDPEFRRNGLRLNAQHGDRVSPAEFLAIADDVVGCVLADDLAGEDRQLEPAHDLDVPITIAWAEHDNIFPPDDHVAEARSRLPQAEVVTLPDVGHVPMFDDPALVARTILRTTGASDG